MIRNYLKIAFRNLWKSRTQSLVGIFGLAFALACFIPAIYWLRYETSYDSFYPDSDQIYRVYTTNKQNGKTSDLVSGILERRLNEQYPAMQNSTLFYANGNDFSSELTPHAKLQTIFTDSSFLHVFPQRIIYGDYRRPLQLANSVILTEKAALRLFGEAKKAIGQKIKSTTLLKDDAPYTVTAVIEDAKPNTNLPFEAILAHDQISMQKSFPESSGNEIWDFAMLQMYVKIPAGSNNKLLSEQLREFPLKSYKNSDVEVHMLPASEVRHKLNPDVPFTLNFIRIFIAAGMLLLFSAVFNFLNLYFDIFRQRSREFRLRTINGATRKQLKSQMLFELTCAILITLFPAYLITLMGRPFFYNLVNIRMEISVLSFLFFIVAAGVLLSLIMISNIMFSRISRTAMKPQTQNEHTGRPILQRAAITIQLAVSIIIIIASSVVMMQMRFINHKDLGFNQEGIICLSGLNPFIEPEKREAIVAGLRTIPQIQSITDTYFSPQHNVNPFQMTTNVEWQGKSQSDNPAFNFITTDKEFKETFGVNMINGDWINDTGEPKVVLNEEAVRIMGLKEPIGSLIRIKLNDDKQYRVVGVVKDFHTLSLRSRILPTLFIKSEYPTNSFYVRVTPDSEQEVIRQINTILPKIDATFSDTEPVELNELYNRLNESERAGLKIFTILAVVCLFISLIGIYAVATAGTIRRRKEIAIRKVAGARANDIISLFFKEYTIQVIIAGIIALPLTYAGISRWLEGYAYRINTPWLLFAGVIGGIITAVLLTVLRQVVQAANSNPANVIKSE